MFKKMLAVLLAVCVIGACCPFPAQEVKVAAAGGEIEGKFVFEDDDFENYRQIDFKFDPELFATKAAVYNKSLSTLSQILAIGSFGYNESEANQDNTISILLTGEATDPNYVDPKGRPGPTYDNFGFTDFYSSDYYHKRANYHSVAVAIAQKDITVTESGSPTEYTLIAVGIRGGGYNREFGGNFIVTPETSMYSYGFDQTSNQVVAEIKKYLNDTEYQPSDKSKPLKIWVAGYSRGAATSNLVGAKLIDEVYTSNMLGEYNLTFNDIYAYTFETPNTVLGNRQTPAFVKDSRYFGIHNIINLNDFVCKVPVAVWNYTRFGKDYYLPINVNNKKYKDQLAAMLKMLKDKMGVDNPKEYYKMENFTHYTWDIIWGTQKNPKNKTPMNVYLDDVFKILGKDISKDTSGYAAKYQAPMAFVAALANDVKDETAMEAIIKDLEAYSEKGWNIAWKLITQGYQGFREKVTNIMYDNLMRYGYDKPNYNHAEVAGTATGLVDLAINYIWKDVDSLVTFGENEEIIVQGHFATICLAWLMSQDTYYNPSAATLSEAFEGNGIYRTVYINSPVDVVVKDNGTEVAKITGGIPWNKPIIVDGIEYSSEVAATIDDNGQMVLYLPPNGAYDIELTGTGDGALDVTITEDDFKDGETIKMWNYYDLGGTHNVDQGDTYTISLPSLVTANPISDSGADSYATLYSGGSIDNHGYVSGTYTFNETTSISTPITATYVTDEQNTTKPLEVPVTITATGSGIASGARPRVYGNYATVKALPREGASFIGWYDNSDKQITTDKSYRFRVTAPVALVAKFTQLAEAPANYIGQTPTPTPTPAIPAVPAPDLNAPKPVTMDDYAEKVKNAPEGATIVIDLGSGTFIPAKIFEQAANRNVTIEVRTNGCIFTFNGMDFKNLPANFPGADLQLTLNPTNLDHFRTANTVAILSLPRELPFPFKLTYPLGEGHSNSKLHLIGLNKAKTGTEQKGTLYASNTGSITFIWNGGAFYIVSAKALE